MSDDIRMKDVPMTDFDRENMRNEWENFDNMTLAEFREAAKKRTDELLDLYNSLGDG